ncbi:MAG TPA: presqualene diphosphate synthase HpnD [Nitrospiria bacterium]|jgi:phytoene synthase|nr:presqualene diphosphate synthase HpnD [Nitrospiria bacterium]
MRSKQFGASITKKSGSNFYYSFLFLPKVQRRAIYTVYAFCRLVDDAVDSRPSHSEAAAELSTWRKELDQCYHGQPNHPLSRELQPIIRQFEIPQDYFQELLNGIEMDLIKKRYATFSELSEYCYRVASVIGLICIRIFGCDTQTVREHAIHQGMAFQLTNVLRDLGTDADRGRIYLPLDELARFGYSEAELLRSTYNPAFVELMRFQTQRAKRYYEKAKSLIPREARRALVASEIMGAIYENLLDVIEERRYRVFDERISLSTIRKASLALQAYLKNRSAAV